MKIVSNAISSKIYKLVFKIIAIGLVNCRSFKIQNQDIEGLH